MAASGSTTNAAHDFRPLFVAGLYGVAAFRGCALTISENSLVDFLSTLLLACFPAAWCVADARLRGRPLLPVVQMITFLLWPIAVPIYLVASRGWRGVGYALLHAVGLYVICLIAILVTAFIAF